MPALVLSGITIVAGGLLLAAKSTVTYLALDTQLRSARTAGAIAGGSAMRQGQTAQ